MAMDESTTAAPDPLGVDDRAWAIVPPTALRTVLLVSKGDPYLETALSYLPDTEALWGTTPDRYASDMVRPDGTTWDLIIFEGFLPAELPPTPILAIAPPSSSPLGTVAGTLANPGIGSVDSSDPILRYVDPPRSTSARRRSWSRPPGPGP